MPDLKEQELTHPAIIKTSALVNAGDLAGAERTLMAIAEHEGDHALVTVLDEVPPKDLLAIMREFDASRESAINLLVTPEQFARAAVLDARYGEESHDRLRGMMNAILYRDPEEAVDFLDALGAEPGGLRVLVNYFSEHRDEIREFAHTGNFRDGAYGRMHERPDPEDEAIDISEREDPYAAPEGFDPDAAPKIKRVEIADRDWMETAWVLRYEATEVFEDLLHSFDRDEEAEVEAFNAVLGAVAQPTPARDSASEDEESAL